MQSIIQVQLRIPGNVPANGRHVADNGTRHAPRRIANVLVLGNGQAQKGTGDNENAKTLDQGMPLARVIRVGFNEPIKGVLQPTNSAALGAAAFTAHAAAAAFTVGARAAAGVAAGTARFGTKGDVEFHDDR